MKFSHSLDVNVVAHEANDEVTVMIELEAPPAPPSQRAPAAIQVVLDRSGSMSGEPLNAAKRALVALVERLDPQDTFGVVVFDSVAEIAVPNARVTDKARMIAAIEAIAPQGMTDLVGGYLRGLQELKRARATADIRGGTLLLISDGHTNQGIRDTDQAGGIATRGAADDIVTSTIGYGNGYDETMLEALSRNGNGNHAYADSPESAGVVIAGEVDGLLDKVVQGAHLLLEFTNDVTMLQLYNDLPATNIGPRQIMIEMGDLYAEEQRKLLLRLAIPGVVALGSAQVATMTLKYVELPALVEQTVALPVSVNVVPGDQAAQRVPDPTVESERLFQEAQEAKLRASKAYEAGDLDTGSADMVAAAALLETSAALAPERDKADVDNELSTVRRMRDEARNRSDAGIASKMTRASYHAQSRKRGRD